MMLNSGGGEGSTAAEILVEIIKDELKSKGRDDLLPLVLEIMRQSDLYVSTKRDTIDVIEQQAQKKKFEGQLQRLIEEYVSPIGGVGQ